jgi:hypothetical protein
LVIWLEGKEGETEEYMQAIYPLFPYEAVHSFYENTGFEGRIYISPGGLKNDIPPTESEAEEPRP